LFVVVDQVKEDNGLNDNVENDLHGSIVIQMNIPNTGRLTVRRDTPTISLFCLQWATSFLNASISNLEGYVRDLRFTRKDEKFLHEV
jgi:hypothetical protein